jgi:chloramphenicol 3-O phosphotransferase
VQNVVVPAAGRVVVLNGTSSSGKSALAQRFQEERAAEGDCWLVLGIDDINAKLPPQWWKAPGWEGPYNDDGVRMEPAPDGLVIEAGALGRRLFAAYRRTAATWARAGFNVLVDEVAFDRECVEDWKQALGGLRVTWVGVRCDPDVAEARERARGDRTIGLARGLEAVVHEHVEYDFELDTSTSSVSELSDQLARIIQTSSS